MDRCVFFLFALVLSVLCNNDASEGVVAPPSAVAKSAGICGLCQCSLQRQDKGLYHHKIKCIDKKLTKFFTKEQWADLEGLNVTYVDLSENFFTNVMVIAELPLKVLNLSYNRIDVIENASFGNLHQMAVLDLSHNNLTSEKLSPQAFQGHYVEYVPLTVLRTLSLAYNDLHRLHPELFHHVSMLTELDLSGNPLKTLDHGVLTAVSDLPFLSVLRMRSCQLTEIPERFFHATRLLERLDISDNQLKAVPQELREAKNLVFLNLNQNPIVMLDTRSEDYPGFPRLPNLKELHMCNMPELHSVGSGSLAGLESLVKLHMSFNPKLKVVDTEALVSRDEMGMNFAWPPIKELYLQSNNLSEVVSYFIGSWEFIEKINVSDNPFICYCTSKWMIVNLVPIVDKTSGDSSLMVCREPVEMRGYTMKHLYDNRDTIRCVDRYIAYHEQDGWNSMGSSTGGYYEDVTWPPSTMLPSSSDYYDNVTWPPSTKPPSFSGYYEDVTRLPSSTKPPSFSCYYEDVSMPPPTKNVDYSLLDVAVICSLCQCEDNQKIDCIDKKLTTFFTINEWAELDLFNKSHVDLSKNLIANVTAVADLPLKVLNLSHNMIEFIEAGSFRYLHQLEVLDLSHNRLTEFSPSALEGCPYPRYFEPLAALRTLNLAYNDLHSLDQNLFFSNAWRLTELDLSGNPLKTLDDDTLGAISNLIHLKVLRLRSCQLTYINISDKIFFSPLFLERLDISDNQLSALPRVLKKTKSLVFLNLSQNPIEWLDYSNGFPLLKNMTELHMSNMPELRRVGGGAMAGLENLVKLNISFNPNLSDVDAKALARPGHRPPIKELYLQSNNLSEVEFRLINRWDLVEKIDVSGNPFMCDCSTRWMVDILVPVVDRTGGDSSLMICQEPAAMQGHTMKHLYAAHHTKHCVENSGQYPEVPELYGSIFTVSPICLFFGSLVVSFIVFGIMFYLVCRVCHSRSSSKQKQGPVLDIKLENGK